MLFKIKCWTHYSPPKDKKKRGMIVRVMNKPSDQAIKNMCNYLLELIDKNNLYEKYLNKPPEERAKWELEQKIKEEKKLLARKRRWKKVKRLKRIM